MSEDFGETRRGVSAADPEAGPEATEGPGAKRGRPTARPRGARLVDIAEAVGVHVSTVSRVLNGDPAQSVRPEVYRKILSTARQQGYRPNALARALKRRQTGAIAFVIPLLRNPIWVRLQRGALQRAADRGYVVMIMEEPGEDAKPPGAYRPGIHIAEKLRVVAIQGGWWYRGVTSVEPHPGGSLVTYTVVNVAQGWGKACR